MLSTKHYINLGGSEMVVYRATPADVESGVQVGDLEYPGYPASGAKVEGVNIADPAVKIAFFALRYDQDVNTPMHAYREGRGGQHRARRLRPPRRSRSRSRRARSRSTTSSSTASCRRFYERPTEVKPDGDHARRSSCVINGELRQKNAEKIASFAKQSAPEILWGGVVFHPFTNTAVEAAFADQRTYIYKGKEVDRQTHLGFDLARVVNSPIVAANRGKVLYAARSASTATA